MQYGSHDGSDCRSRFTRWKEQQDFQSQYPNCAMILSGDSIVEGAIRAAAVAAQLIRVKKKFLVDCHSFKNSDSLSGLRSDGHQLSLSGFVRLMDSSWTLMIGNFFTSGVYCYCRFCSRTCFIQSGYLNHSFLIRSVLFLFLLLFFFHLPRFLYLLERKSGSLPNSPGPLSLSMRGLIIWY